MDNKKKRLKPRYIVFFTVSLTLIAAYAVYLIIVGSTYSVPIISLGRVDSSSIDIKMSDDGIVEVVKINEPQRFSDGANSVFIDLHSINSGKVTLTLHYQEDLSAAAKDLLAADVWAYLTDADGKWAEAEAAFPLKISDQ